MSRRVRRGWEIKGKRSLIFLFLFETIIGQIGDDRTNIQRRRLRQCYPKEIHLYLGVKPVKELSFIDGSYLMIRFVFYQFQISRT